MLNMKLLQGIALGLAVIGFGFTAPVASAGGCSSGYYRGGHGHSHGNYVSVSHHSSRFSVSVSVGRNYDRGCYQPQRVYYDSCRTTYRSSPRVVYQTTRCEPVVHVRPAPQPCGYWRQVWNPPVYQTRYDNCGYPYRVQVAAGYYDRVWVEY